MQTILRYQNDKENGHDILLIDGIPSEYSGTQEQKAALKAIAEDRFVQKCFVANDYKEKSNPKLSIRKSANNELLVSSWFLSKDDKGRRIPYTFYVSQFSTFAEARMLLEKNARQVYKELNPYDCAALEHASDSKPLPMKTIFAIGVVVLIIIIISLCQ